MRSSLSEEPSWVLNMDVCSPCDVTVAGSYFVFAGLQLNFFFLILSNLFFDYYTHQSQVKCWQKSAEGIKVNMLLAELLNFICCPKAGTSSNWKPDSICIFHTMSSYFLLLKKSLYFFVLWVLYCLDLDRVLKVLPSWEWRIIPQVGLSFGRR